MSIRLHLVVATAAAVSVTLLAAFPAAAQTGGGGGEAPIATDRKLPPKPEPTGAWWQRGAAPVAQDGHPDFTGVWAGRPSGDLSESTLPGQDLVLTEYGQQRWDTVDHAKDPNTFCLPSGPARMIMMAHPAMVVQRPDVVAILTESQRTFRIIYTDGRGHPNDVYEYPEWMGSSIGQWEGDTLVVDTVAINDRTWLDTAGHEHSDQLHMTERFRLAEPNMLEHVVTYTDPVFFVRPFTTRRVFERQIGDRILDHACLENEKDIELLVPTLGDAGR